MEIKNISQIVRSIDYLGKAVFSDVGDALAKGIMEEFEQLVIETPQWTGSAAASWNISLGGDSSVREQPERTKTEALEKGHADAVGIALQHNKHALDGLSSMPLPGKGQKGNSYRAIVVQNNSESADPAESGPLRDINKPAGAGMRFEERVASKSFEIIRSRKL